MRAAPAQPTDEPPNRRALFAAVGIAGLVAVGGGTWFAIRPVARAPVLVMRPRENVFRPPPAAPVSPPPPPAMIRLELAPAPQVDPAQSSSSVRPR
jgi:hypothetical protein